ncbi:MAG TPA: adenylate/guanylate cyclase domain-containing protein [Chthonomonadaceae bacterium]|nr:adenylate/guanylate cyclase domain-containing protein [Chthonomonadaceae bacterium]
MSTLSPPSNSKPALPTGVITLLFTDIAGSTRLWDQHGDRFIPVWQAHDAIVRDAIARFSGHEVKTEGDAFMVAFADPIDALHCALFIQAALARYPWPPDIGPLRVRMGLHTGEPFVHGNDYFGPVVNRAAHICNAAQGGQVLLSEATHGAVKDGSDPKINLDDLGDHRLKDLGAPQRLYAAVHPSMEMVDPLPPRTLEGQPNNLPIQRTSFVGRAKEIEQIASYLARGEKPVLTLTGPGGIGKTRLSLQAAAATAEWFPDGVWYIRLVEARDIVGAAVEIAAAMHIPLDRVRPPLEQVREWLADRRCLLILDDAGTLPHADRLIRELLSGSTSLRCLATARESLQIDEAGELELEGLPLTPAPPLLPEAVVAERPAPSEDMLVATDAGRLFLERRAESGASSLDLPPKEIAAVEQLLHKSEGFPLLVERIVKLIETYPPAAIVAWLEEQLAPEPDRQDAPLAPPSAIHEGTAEERIQQLARTGVERFKGIMRKGAQKVRATVEEKKPAMHHLGHFVQAIANVATDRKDEKQAVDLGRASLQISQHAGDELGMAAALRQLARVYWQQGNRESAVAILTVAVELYRHHQGEDLGESQQELDRMREQMGHSRAAMTSAPSVDNAVALALGENN